MRRRLEPRPADGALGALLLRALADARFRQTNVDPPNDAEVFARWAGGDAAGRLRGSTRTPAPCRSASISDPGAGTRSSREGRRNAREGLRPPCRNYRRRDEIQNPLRRHRIDDGSIARLADVEHERATAIWGLIPGTSFAPSAGGGPYRLRLGIVENRLALEDRRGRRGPPVAVHLLSLTPFPQDREGLFPRLRELFRRDPHRDPVTRSRTIDMEPVAASTTTAHPGS